ncbi:YCF48-related protein [Paenibacillus sp. PAMC 26794]|uniref:YCF48-related protein n=1 Tax=Paenibacillus sp. PAMC 26794 TaxID=1257080 RepID=UPI0002ED2AF6|nr:YCF48-related protein [Paenibacillus sp. PAMC 26794]
MRMFRLLKLVLIVILMYTLMIPTSSNVVQSAESYRWDQIPIGGGGYVTAVVVHPTEPDLVYARTDIGGVYRLDPINNRWIPLLDHIEADESNLYGIDGIALDHQNPDIIYIAAGKYANGSPSDILKSTDRGETWTRTGLNLRNVSNGNIHRAMGESIAVNPSNSNYLHVGTRYDGLYTSSNGGDTWSQVREVPYGLSGQGIRSVVYGVNPAAKHEQVVYVGVRGIGIFAKMKRSNGQMTWELIRNSPESTARMTVSKSGILYVTTDNRGILKYNGKQWTNITPSSEYSSYYGISIDPSNDNHILAAVRTGGSNLPLYRSTNSGQTWTSVNKTLNDRPPWWTSNMFFSATSSIVFDPHHPGRVYASDWSGVFKTDDITQPMTQWDAITDGHEEVVALSAATPPQGAAFFSGVADQVGFRHSDIFNTPIQDLPLAGMQEVVSIDYHEADPNQIIYLGSNDWYGTITKLFVSTDNGLTTTSVNVPAGSQLGRIAYSASNPDLIIYFPQKGKAVRSTNKGVTWQSMNGLPSNNTGGESIFTYNQTLAADRTNGNKFYAYYAGHLYRTINGGANWMKANIVALPQSEKIKVEAAPEMENVVWVSLGGAGLYASNSSGAAFTKIQNVQSSELFAFGKGKSGGVTPAVFIYGTVNQVKGFFRSYNMGLTWENITPETEIGIGNEPQVMEADRQTYGKVYVGTNGRGLFTGYFAQ